MEQLPRLYLSRQEMMKRVARFKDLKGSDGGLPDSKMPGCERTLFNVIGFQPPKGSAARASLARTGKKAPTSASRTTSLRQ